jgi:hypothetical protein
MHDGVKLAIDIEPDVSEVEVCRRVGLFPFESV